MRALNDIEKSMVRVIDSVNVAFPFQGQGQKLTILIGQYCVTLTLPLNTLESLNVSSESFLIS